MKMTRWAAFKQEARKAAESLMIIVVIAVIAIIIWAAYWAEAIRQEMTTLCASAWSRLRHWLLQLLS